MTLCNLIFLCNLSGAVSENKLELICLALKLGMMGLMVVLGDVEHSLWICCLIFDSSFGNHDVLCVFHVVVADKVVEGVAGNPWRACG